MTVEEQKRVFSTLRFQDDGEDDEDDEDEEPPVDLAQDLVLGVGQGVPDGEGVHGGHLEGDQEALHLEGAESGD